MLERLKQWMAPKTSGAEVAAPDGRQAFASALARYGDHVPPHRGLGREVSVAQAQQNLDWFMQTRAQRLAGLQALGAATGFDLEGGPVHSLSDAEARVGRLIAWTRACWPETPLRPAHLDDEAWAASARTGDDAIFSVVLDVATLLGETAMAGRSEWRWGLDLQRASLGRQPMLSARRVVLITPPVGESGAPCMMDLEALVLSRYRTPRSIYFNGPLAHDSWMEHVRDGYTGRVMDLMKGASTPSS